MAGQGRVFNYEDGDGQPDNTLMLIRSETGLQHISCSVYYTLPCAVHAMVVFTHTMHDTCVQIRLYVQKQSWLATKCTGVYQINHVMLMITKYTTKIYFKF